MKPRSILLTLVAFLALVALFSGCGRDPDEEQVLEDFLVSVVDQEGAFVGGRWIVATFGDAVTGRAISSSNGAVVVRARKGSSFTAHQQSNDFGVFRSFTVPDVSEHEVVIPDPDPIWPSRLLEYEAVTIDVSVTYPRVTDSGTSGWVRAGPGCSEEFNLGVNTTSSTVQLLVAPDCRQDDGTASVVAGIGDEPWFDDPDFFSSDEAIDVPVDDTTSLVMAPVSTSLGFVSAKVVDLPSMDNWHGIMWTERKGVGWSNDVGSKVIYDDRLELTFRVWPQFADRVYTLISGSSSGEDDRFTFRSCTYRGAPSPIALAGSEIPRTPAPGVIDSLTPPSVRYEIGGALESDLTVFSLFWIDTHGEHSWQVVRQAADSRLEISDVLPIVPDDLASFRPTLVTDSGSSVSYRRSLDGADPMTRTDGTRCYSSAGRGWHPLEYR